MSDPDVAQDQPAGAPAPLTVKLEVFEGPLDLLLHLIRKNELEITDIPIAEVTEQYMQYLNFMKELNLDVAGDYLVMAATLVHIKSKLLLPVEPEPESEEGEDPRAELVKQLLEYEKFQRVAEELRSRQLLEQASFLRGAPTEFEQEEELVVEASLFDLMAAFKELLESTDEPATFAIETYRTSVADRVQHLMGALEQKQHLGFQELFQPGADRHEWIVTFLALLELVRLHFIRILQRGRLGPIEIVRREAVDAPSEPSHGSDSP